MCKSKLFIFLKPRFSFRNNNKLTSNIISGNSAKLQKEKKKIKISDTFAPKPTDSINEDYTSNIEKVKLILK
jgi:hypothetical protein